MSDLDPKMIVPASLKLEDWGRVIASLVVVNDQDYDVIAEVLRRQVSTIFNDDLEVST